MIRAKLPVVFFPFAALALAQTSGQATFFETRVRPLLANNCYACHTDNQLGGLRVDSRAALLQGGKSGAAIVPGDPAGSRLIKAVEHTDPDPQKRMPLAGNKLKDNEIADLRRWIETGAFWPRQQAAPATTGGKFSIRPEHRNFWAFRPLAKPVLPRVKDTAWPKNAMDRFILAKLEEKGLQPVGPADKRTLLRRATYDLTGLPPTPEQVEAFLADSSPGAFATVVERLLESPHYGERWGRHWLDVARYADGTGRPDTRPVFLGYGTSRDGYANTWRYRDWVVQALNEDMPYDQFVRAQIAADLLPEEQREKMLPGLGFFGIGPWFTGDDVVFVEARANERDDKIDVLTKGFLGLTVTCARCHDHKYDPISQQDYYALGGIFKNSSFWEYSLAARQQVDAFHKQRKHVQALETALEDAAGEAARTVATRLAGEIPQYMMAVRKALLSGENQDLAKAAEAGNLDAELLKRWFRYLTEVEKLHPYLKTWDALIAQGGGKEAEALNAAEAFRDLVLRVIPEKKAVIAATREILRNYKPDPGEDSAVLPGDLMQFELFQFKQKLVPAVMETHHFYVYIDVVLSEDDQSYVSRKAVLEFPPQDLLKYLTGEEKATLNAMQAEVEIAKKAMPPEYPYLMGLKDNPEPENIKINVRGNAHMLGDEVHRGFPAVLAGTNGEPLPFTSGSGRLELAEAIISHPLAARVMANRIWLYHFGRGIVNTPGNFGTMGERPSHPELLEYLAARFVESNWSMKAMHREIMLSATYQLAYERTPQAMEIDPDNRLLSRANFRRLEVEALRDSLLFVTGMLDERLGGPPQALGRAENKKRTLYGRASRSPDDFLTLFDYPDPNITNDQREVTNVPTQGLFFLNSPLLMRQAEALVNRLRLEGESEADTIARIRSAYRSLFQREPTAAETGRGLAFLKKARAEFTMSEPPKVEPGSQQSPDRSQGASDEDEGGDEAPSTGAKLTPWQAYAQALLSSGEFLYLN